MAAHNNQVNFAPTAPDAGFDVAMHLRTPEEMATYLEAAIEEGDGDAAFIAMALGDIARAKGMAELARETGLGRESLYKALSAEGNPQLSTVLKVARALGLQFHVKPTPLRDR